MTSRRLTVQEAAEVLGTSVDAVRMRARRGALGSDKDPDGRVYVWVDADDSETKQELNGESAALISAKDETIRVLEEQLREERESRRRADTIIAQLTQANAALAARVPELEAPQSHADEAERAEPRSNTEGPHVAQERPFTNEEPRRRSWWREFFGFE
jgi:hypothetical protein